MYKRQGYFSRKPIQLLLDAGYRDCYRTIHRQTPGYTYPAPQPWMRLDYLFASPLLAPHIRDCQYDTSDLAQKASDHLPIWITL